MLLDSLKCISDQTYKRKDKCSLPVTENNEVCAGVKLSRVSSSAFCRGSLTVEAACVLPMFLYAILAVMYFILAVTVQGSVLAELVQTGKELAVYAYAYEKGEKTSDFAVGTLSSAYVKNKVVSRLRKEQVNTSVMAGGTTGISLAGSSFLEENMIKLNAAYRLEFPVPLFHLGSMDTVQKAVVRAWTGRSGSVHAEADTEEKQNQMVYVTSDGTVYHNDENCSHIRLSVHMVDYMRIGGLRNQSGAKYYPCESCGESHGQGVYITETGDRYHSSVNCRGLKRSVMKVPVSSLEGWRPCTRCGG